MSLRMPGSRAPNGSSSSNTRGFMISAWAMASRCCMPPESCAGYLSSEWPRPTLCSSTEACSRASFFALPNRRPSNGERGSSRPRATLSSTVKCGNTE
ncbi:hypothetical protein D3C86_1539500 [compost metagenome]